MKVSHMPLCFRSCVSCTRSIPTFFYAGARVFCEFGVAGKVQRTVAVECPPSGKWPEASGKSAMCSFEVADRDVKSAVVSVSLMHEVCIGVAGADCRQ